MSTHPDRAQIWLLCGWQGSDFSPPTAVRIRGVCYTHIYTHTDTLSKKWKTPKLSREEYIKCLHKPWSIQKQTCSVLLVLFISKLWSLVVHLRNKLAGTKKLPELPSQKPPVFPDGGLVHWTGKAKKQTKHNCSRFTHICTSSRLCTSTCTHKNTDYSVGTKKYVQRAAICIFRFLKDANT